MAAMDKVKPLDLPSLTYDTQIFILAAKILLYYAENRQVHVIIYYFLVGIYVTSCYLTHNLLLCFMKDVRGPHGPEKL